MVTDTRRHCLLCWGSIPGRTRGGMPGIWLGGCCYHTVSLWRCLAILGSWHYCSWYYMGGAIHYFNDVSESEFNIMINIHDYRSYIQRECHSVLAKLHPITFYRGVRGSWSECHFVFSLVYQLCLAL